MAHADDATKAWVSAVPTTNADGNVMDWHCKYKYTLNSYSHTFDRRVIIETPSKAPAAYTQAELLTLMDKDYWDDMFNKKYTVSIAVASVETTDASFDINTLEE
jgi:hypothetical protein